MYVCMDLLYRKYDLNHNIGVSGSSAPFREGLGRRAAHFPPRLAEH